MNVEFKAWSSGFLLSTDPGPENSPLKMSPITGYETSNNSGHGPRATIWKDVPDLKAQIKCKKIPIKLHFNVYILKLTCQKFKKLKLVTLRWLKL